jgi:hypothetical protein
MRLKVREVSDLVMPYGVLDGFEVDVRRLTQHQSNDLAKMCSRPVLDPVTRAMVDKLNEDLWAAEAPKRYIADWRGLTASIIRRLGVDLEEDPPAGDDGFIPFDVELATDLWKYAHGDKFAIAICNVSREMLAADELRRKKN